MADSGLATSDMFKLGPDRSTGALSREHTMVSEDKSPDEPVADTKQDLRVAAIEFDRMKRLWLGPEAYKNYVFKA